MGTSCSTSTTVSTDVEKKIPTLSMSSSMSISPLKPSIHHTKSHSMSLNVAQKALSTIPPLVKSSSHGDISTAKITKAFYNFYGDSEPSEPSDWGETAEMNLHSLLDVEPYFDAPAEFHFAGKPVVEIKKKKSKFLSLFSKKKSANTWSVGPSPSTFLNTTTPKPAKVYWAKGTGFGHYTMNSAEWDNSRWLKQRVEASSSEAEACQQLACRLSKQILTKDAAKRFSRSCVGPYLLQTLRSASQLEMQRHEKLYRIVFAICRELSRQPHLRAMLTNTHYGSESLDALLSKHFTQAEKTQDLLSSNSSSQKRNGSEMNSFIIDIVTDINRDLDPCCEPSSASAIAMTTTTSSGAADGRPCIMKLVDRLSELTGVSSVEESDEVKSSDPDGNIDEKSLSSDPTISSAHEFSQEYVSVMTPQRFEETEQFSSHHYSLKFSSGFPRKWLRRVAAEYSDLSTSLPVSPESSIFVRVAEGKMGLLKFMIIAPPGTPYAHGCFVFDAVLPSDYPASPPKVNLMTTGGGSVRFNPNLYNCGKVCLSILNTWSGQKSEKWGPHATFLQILISIQSLVFVPDPYFNEPGYESSMGTPHGTQRSKQYDKGIRKGTMLWAIQDMLRNPPKEFKTVIENHFYLHRKAVIEQCYDWGRQEGCTERAKAIEASLNLLSPPKKAELRDDDDMDTDSDDED
uniref:Baculoviral IAP repeat-containing protein 6-like isoform X1 n=2 Tax=Hirondellea gigas TaxID=1518452 RepID=A0A6A7FV32_9CRUS